MKIRAYLQIWLAVLAVFIFDRILKYFFIKNPAEIFGGDFFSFHFERNYGIAFGIGLNDFMIIILVLLIIIFLIAYLVRSCQRHDLMSVFLVSLIIAGAVSNLIDRLKFGYVVDYIDVPWFTVFNLADSAITVGALLLALIFWITDRKKSLTSAK